MGDTSGGVTVPGNWLAWALVRVELYREMAKDAGAWAEADPGGFGGDDVLLEMWTELQNQSEPDFTGGVHGLLAPGEFLTRLTEHQNQRRPQIEMLRQGDAG